MEVNNISDGYRQCIGPCNLIKPLEQFHKRNSGKDGHTEMCKACKSEYDKCRRRKFGDSLRKQQKKYREKHKAGIIAKQREKIKNRTPEEIQKKKDYLADYYIKNKEKIKKTTRRNKNRPGVKEERNAIERDRYHNDKQHRLEITARSRVAKFMKENHLKKPASVSKSLGCSWKELSARLESLFYDNPETGEKMTWENKGKWHIDHIIPLSFFDMENKEQFIIACNYLNLQPLWEKENLEKSAKVPKNVEEIINQIKESIKNKE